MENETHVCLSSLSSVDQAKGAECHHHHPDDDDDDERVFDCTPFSLYTFIFFYLVTPFIFFFTFVLSVFLYYPFSVSIIVIIIEPGAYINNS